MTERVFLQVRGICPVPWGSNEWDWRRALASEGRRVLADMDPFVVTAVTHFEVVVVFLMNAAHIGRSDLDNLAKPVLDTLFRSRYAQVKDLDLTGALFNVDDDRVFKLTLEKRLVATDADEGIDVSITWE